VIRVVYEKAVKSKEIREMISKSQEEPWSERDSSRALTYCLQGLDHQRL
jgi:hypothetical protein